MEGRATNIIPQIPGCTRTGNAALGYLERERAYGRALPLCSHLHPRGRTGAYMRARTHATNLHACIYTYIKNDQHGEYTQTADVRADALECFMLDSITPLLLVVLSPNPPIIYAISIISFNNGYFCLSRRQTACSLFFLFLSRLNTLRS